MSDPYLYVTLATAGLVSVAIITAAALAGWRGWLALKQQELLVSGQSIMPSPTSASARIEIADLKERIRKLEAIAAGVDL